MCAQEVRFFVSRGFLGGVWVRYGELRISCARNESLGWWMERRLVWGFNPLPDPPFLGDAPPGSSPEVPRKNCGRFLEVGWCNELVGGSVGDCGGEVDHFADLF